jgi:hypothetical protein
LINAKILLTGMNEKVINNQQGCLDSQIILKNKTGVVEILFIKESEFHLFTTCYDVTL